MTIGRTYDLGLPVNNVAASSPFTAQVPIGQTIEALKLKFGGGAMTPALLTALRLVANGKTIVDVTGADLKKINAYRGVAANDSYLDLRFLDPTGESEADRMVGAFDTSLGIDSLMLEGNIGAATTPTMAYDLTRSGAQRTSDGQPVSGAGLITKLKRVPFDVSAAGDLVVPLPYGRNGTRIKRLYFFSQYMTALSIKENGRIIHKSVKAANEDEQKAFGRTPQTNVYIADFVIDGHFGKAWNTVGLSDIEVMPTFSQADSGNIYAEMLDPLLNN